MEMINEFLSDKRTYMVMIVAYIIIMIIVLIFIWSPDKVEPLAEYTPYNANERLSDMANYYSTDIVNALTYYDDSYISTIISDEYLKYKNLTARELYNDLRITRRYNLTNLNTYTVGDVVIYAMNLTSNGKTVKVSVIETEPYKYKLGFDGFYSYIENNKKYQNSGISIMLKSTYKNIDRVEYQLLITNESNTYVSFDFSTATNVYVITSSGNEYYLNNVESSHLLSNLKQGKFEQKNIIFNVPIGEQDDIESLVMLNVNIGGSVKDIKLSL